MTLYDAHGRPTAYSDDGVSIYLFTGRPVAYIVGNAVFAFSGKHLGWWQNGWLRDPAGAISFFSESATGAGLVKPVTGVTPVKAVKAVEPVKGVRQVLQVPEVPRGLCLTEEYVRSMRLCGELGLTFDLCMRPEELADAAKLVELCPHTRFVLDHCGNASARDPERPLLLDPVGEAPREVPARVVREHRDRRRRRGA